MKDDIQIRTLTSPAEKKAAARRVLEALPQWFGIPEAREEYIRESAGMPFGAAVRDSAALGFLALRETSPHAAEIYVMGVLPGEHRHGAGRALVDWAKSVCREKGYSFLSVKTLDSSAESPEYDRTRAFYRAVGFLELECFPTLWDEDNPCLLMVQAL